jgi:ABC-type multidrug transport system fused ATPase/permease subunit
VALLVVSSVIAGFCESTILALLAEIATALVNHRSSVTLSLGSVHLTASVDQLLAVGLGVAVVRIALQGVLSYLPARIVADTQVAWQHRLFAAYTEASWSAVASDAEGTFQELATSQIVQATNGIAYAVSVVSAGILVIVLVASALVIQPLTALVVMTGGLALSILFRPLNDTARRQARALSSAQVGYAAGIHDAVSTAEETRVFGVGAVQMDQIDTLSRQQRQWVFLTQFMGRLVGGGYQSLVLLLLLAGLGILEAAGAAGHLASLGAVVLLLVRASNFGQLVQGNYHMMQQARPHLERIDAAVEGYVTSRVLRGSRSLSTIPSVEFQDVTYAYVSGRPVLRAVSFRVEPSEIIGVVGPTGAGKSTLVQLLLGLREPQSGSYLVAEGRAEVWSSADWAKRVSYVPQEPRLLHGTVTDNIRFYRPLDHDAVWQAARQAHIHEEVLEWPLGYDTVISNRAKAVSGGQRQRLCLARALAGRPVMLVLDEPTSALDPRSEALVQESLAALKGHMTIFVIAHRLSTLNLCDRIMVLRAGMIEVLAPRDEVLQSNDFYRNAVRLSQFRT